MCDLLLRNLDKVGKDIFFWFVDVENADVTENAKICDKCIGLYHLKCCGDFVRV